MITPKPVVNRLKSTLKFSRYLMLHWKITCTLEFPLWLSGLRIWCCHKRLRVGHGGTSDLGLLWLWHRPALETLMHPLAREHPHATLAPLKKLKNYMHTISLFQFGSAFIYFGTSICHSCGHEKKKIACILLIYVILPLSIFLVWVAFCSPSIDTQSLTGLVTQIALLTQRFMNKQPLWTYIRFTR